MKHYRKNSPQTGMKSKDQGAGISTTLGTVILLLSGLILYSDKVVDYFDIQISHIPYYEKLDVFLWTISGTISPLLICLGYILKGRKWALAAPITAYSVQMTYIFRDVKWVGRDYFWAYTLIFVCCFYLLGYFLKNRATTVGTLKSQIRYVMDKLIIEAPKHVVDEDKFDEEIIEPTLDKLSE